MAKLIESETVERDYGMKGTDAIVEVNGKRFLIRDGFGGMDSLRGGMVRWEHGMVVQLQDGDTIESLIESKWNDSVSLWEAAILGFDDSRPILPYDNPEPMAKSAGLV